MWAPELHYLPSKAADVPGSGGWFISFHFHCSGGGSGVLKSTTGSPFGPYTDLVHGVPGGDVSIFRDPANQQTYAVSSGGALYASRLSNDMATIETSTVISPVCAGTPCEHNAIGFEGPFVLMAAGTYFLSSSAFGNATHHGGPQSMYNGKDAPSNSHYSAYMGAAKSFLGPYYDRVGNGKDKLLSQGNPGSWLAVDNGGHNNYFAYNNSIYATVWFGSEPNGDVPSAYRDLINLPTVVEMVLADGRLVQR